MATAIVLSLLVSGCAQGPSSGDNSGMVPARLARALRKNAPGFERCAPAEFDPAILEFLAEPDSSDPGEKSPSLVRADFDGDGLEDAAMLQCSSTEHRFVVVLDRKPEPLCIELSRWKREERDARVRIGIYLQRLPAGTIDLPNWDTGEVDTTMVLAHDAVEFVTFEKAAEAYFWSDGRFQELVTMD